MNIADPESIGGKRGRFRRGKWLAVSSDVLKTMLGDYEAIREGYGVAQSTQLTPQPK